MHLCPLQLYPFVARYLMPCILAVAFLMVLACTAFLPEIFVLIANIRAIDLLHVKLPHTRPVSHRMCPQTLLSSFDVLL